MKIEIIFGLVSLMGASIAQIPSVGWCPDRRGMADFDIDKYLGTWYEYERYFTVLEAGSRCARTNYTRSTEGTILVSNEITNRLTGVKRVLDGEIRSYVKGDEPKLKVKYSTLPFPMETEYMILDTDYDSYAVVWSCSGFGPIVNSQTIWVMTRLRDPDPAVLQSAYGILDKNKISRTFFVKSDQTDCTLGDAAPESGGKSAPEVPVVSR